MKKTSTLSPFNIEPWLRNINTFSSTAELDQKHEP